jgi:hypothetical protein
MLQPVMTFKHPRLGHVKILAILHEVRSKVLIAAKGWV